jgi:uncharacterized membrane protein YeaQ/YmgE (transglycosylase-associated protein family)
LNDTVFDTSIFHASLIGALPAQGAANLTSALVGVAGSFTGYHLATIAATGGTGIALIAAAIGAALLVWAWRTIKF